MTIHPFGIVSRVEEPILPKLLRIGRLVRAYQSLRLAGIGLQNGQDEFLLALEVDGPSSVGELALRLDVRASTISKMADVLVGRGHVERNACETDTRKTYIRLTADGAAKCEAIYAVWKNLETELLHSATKLNQCLLQDELNVLQAHVIRRLARIR